MLFRGDANKMIHFSKRTSQIVLKQIIRSFFTSQSNSYKPRRNRSFLIGHLLSTLLFVLLLRLEPPLIVLPRGTIRVDKTGALPVASVSTVTDTLVGFALSVV